MANFLSDDPLDYIEDEVKIKSDLSNLDLISKLQDQKKVFQSKIERIDVVITLLKQTPNYSKIHEMLNENI